jgi:hypothetical protein
MAHVILCDHQSNLKPLLSNEAKITRKSNLHNVFTRHCQESVDSYLMETPCFERRFISFVCEEDSNPMEA